MSNNPRPPAASSQTAIQVAVAAQTASNIALANQIATMKATWQVSTKRGVMGQLGAIKLWDYAYQPEHPEDWTAVTTRDLEEGELFEVHRWLRLMSSQPYDTITHYTPALRMLVYFERSQDAAMFKLAWGGE